MTSASSIQWPNLAANSASLADRDARLSVINMFRSVAAAQAPIDATSVERLIAVDHLVYQALVRDLVGVLAEPTSPGAETMLRDVALLHVVAGKAFADLLERHDAWSLPTDRLALQVANLAVHHYAEAAKWGFFRHEPVKAAVWTQLHRLYALAEQQGYAANPCYLYPDEDDTLASITSRYLQTLLLELLNTNNLPAVQTEIADAWLADWASRYALDAQYDTQHHRLFVDIDAPTGLQIITDAAPTEGYRFLRMHDIRYQLAALRELLRAGKLSGGPRVERYAIEDHLALEETFSKLNAAMFDTNSRAIEPRQPVVDQHARVVTGFAGIVAALRETQHIDDRTQSSEDVAPNSGLALAPLTGQHRALVPNAAVSSNTWTLTDISAKGMGLRADVRHDADSVAPGELLLAKVSPDDDADWLLANVARKKIAGETIRIGAETLSREPIALATTRIAAGAPEGSNAAIFDPTIGDSAPESMPSDALWGIYLPGEADDARTDTIVFALADIGASNMVEVSSPAGKFALRLSRVVRKGRSWIAYRFDVLEHRA
jgi:hypothetical protein